MNPDIVKSIMLMFVDAFSKYEPIIGKVAITSSRAERALDELFGYVFDLEYENRTILTSRLRSIGDKIGVIQRSLKLQHSRFPSDHRERIIKVLAELSEFIPIRNNLIHRTIMPDLEAVINLEKTVPEDQIVGEVLKIFEDRFKIYVFTTSGELETVSYRISEVKDIVERTNSTIGRLNAINKDIRPVSFASYIMPYSELMKFED